MKRRSLWLALPLVLLALVLCVKWRIDPPAPTKPAPTKEDLRIRALMRQSSSVSVNGFSSTPGEFYSKVTLSPSESAPFIESFALAPEPKRFRITLCDPRKGVVRTRFQLPPDKRHLHKEDDRSEVFVNIAIAEGEGQATVYYPGFIAKGDYLHSATIKRWMELLLADPRVGPELQKRMSN